jgi:hypothetical protein
VTSGSGPGAGIDAQLGWGPAGTDPRSADTGWTWVEAAYSFDLGGYDVYAASMTPLEAGSYSYAYRFSLDGGVRWLYCDAGAGTSDGFSVTDLGSMEVL